MTEKFLLEIEFSTFFFYIFAIPYTFFSQNALKIKMVENMDYFQTQQNILNT
jgi:hypothetical protein